MALLAVLIILVAIVVILSELHKPHEPQHQYKLKPQKPDDRDVKFNHEEFLGSAVLPQSFDLRPNCPPIYDQGNQGSCTSNAGCACRSMLANNPNLYLSRAFLYYQERTLEGTTSKDAGASIRDICKATAKYGICPDIDMPYTDKDYTTPPTPKSLNDALTYKISAYKSVTNAEAVKTALVSRKQPILIGMTVFSSMESQSVAKSGILPMPKSTEQKMGGHAVLIVGYQDASPKTGFRKLFSCLSTKSKGSFIVRNSWGANWGQAGYFMMPYEYFNKYCYDFWIMEN